MLNRLLTEQILVQTQDKYALLKLTERANEVTGRERTVILRVPKKNPVREEAESDRGGALPSGQRRSDVLNTRGLELFDRLRAVRAGLARSQGIPPYVVFSDKTLTGMCVRTPLNKEEMLLVTGVGENKFEKYGEEFLQAISAFTGGKKEKLYYGEIEDKAESKSKRTGSRNAAVRKAEFYLTPEQAAGYSFTENIFGAELAEKLNGLRDADSVKKLSGAEIFRRMQALSFVGEVFADGYRRKTVSEKGKEAGLFIGMRTSKKGTEYEDIFYSEMAQKMVLDSFTVK